VQIISQETVASGEAQYNDDTGLMENGPNTNKGERLLGE
jgi:hypothetical protein